VKALRNAGGVALSALLKPSSADCAVPSGILANTAISVVRSASVPTEERFIAPLILSFPVSWYQAIRHFRGAQVNALHFRYVPTSIWRVCFRTALVQAPAQAGNQFTAQFATKHGIERVVNPDCPLGILRSSVVVVPDLINYSH